MYGATIARWRHFVTTSPYIRQWRSNPRASSIGYVGPAQRERSELILAPCDEALAVPIRAELAKDMGDLLVDVDDPDFGNAAAGIERHFDPEVRGQGGVRDLDGEE